LDVFLALPSGGMEPLIRGIVFGEFGGFSASLSISGSFVVHQRSKTSVFSTSTAPSLHPNLTLHIIYTLY
jgi:hypothetical protein